MYVSILYWCFSFWLTSLCIMGSSFIHLIRTDSNEFFEGQRSIPGGSDHKASACNVGDLGSIAGWRRSPGEGNGNPLQYSCLENPMDRGAWWVTVRGVSKRLDTTERFHSLHFEGWIIGSVLHIEFVFACAPLLKTLKTLQSLGPL